MKVKNPVTTVSGIIIALVSIIAAVGVINSDQAATLNEIVPILAGIVSSLLLAFGAGDKEKGL